MSSPSKKLNSCTTREDSDEHCASLDLKKKKKKNFKKCEHNPKDEGNANKSPNTLQMGVSSAATDTFIQESKLCDTDSDEGFVDLKNETVDESKNINNSKQKDQKSGVSTSSLTINRETSDQLSGNEEDRNNECIDEGNNDGTRIPQKELYDTQDYTECYSTKCSVDTCLIIKTLIAVITLLIFLKYHCLFTTHFTNIGRAIDGDTFGMFNYTERTWSAECLVSKEVWKKEEGWSLPDIKSGQYTFCSAEQKLLENNITRLWYTYKRQLPSEKMLLRANSYTNNSNCFNNLSSEYTIFSEKWSYFLMINNIYYNVTESLWKWLEIWSKIAGTHSVCIKVDKKGEIELPIKFAYPA